RIGKSCFRGNSSSFTLSAAKNRSEWAFFMGNVFDWILYSGMISESWPHDISQARPLRMKGAEAKNDKITRHFI
ncbi:MAG: hypothetical protein COX20_12505, partial [Desulfobacterales bacterium CG23_combo_of_CG06-09_8_20_14_all_52_9]